MLNKNLALFYRADQLYPWLLFLACTIVLSLIAAVPWPMLNMHVIMPNFMVMILFIWVILRPELCQYSVFFLLGLWQDMVLSIPLGLHAVGNLILLYAISHLRQYIFARPFEFIAASFAAAIAVYSLLLYGFAYLFFGYKMNFAVFAARIAGAVLGFPVVFAVMLKLHGAIVNMSAPR